MSIKSLASVVSWFGFACAAAIAACSLSRSTPPVDQSGPLGSDGGALGWSVLDGGLGEGSPEDGGSPVASPVASRVPFARLPSHGGKTPTNPWSNGEPRIVKDRSPGKDGELLGFGWSDKLYLFKSASSGDSWTYVDPTGGESIGTLDVLCVAQDSAGKIHLLFKNGPGGSVEYARVALSHTGGAITGFSSEVKGIKLPGDVNANNDIRGSLVIARGTNDQEVLVYQVNDNVPGANFRLRMGKATSLSPSATADFVALDGSAGSSLVYSSAEFNNHDHAAGFAQVGSSKDLWVFFGPVEAEFGAPDPTFTTRIRLSPTSPTTWNVGSPISMVGSDAVSSPELLSVYGTQNYVWFAYFDPKDGLSIDRVDAQGQYTHSAIPSPDPAPHRNGWAALSIADDETRAWIIWNSMSRNGPGAEDRTRQGFWNGAGWVLAADPLQGDTWGMGGSVGWSEGVVATRADLQDYGLALSVVRGGAKAP